LIFPLTRALDEFDIVLARNVRGNRGSRTTDIIDDRNLGSVSPIVTIEDVLRESLFDVSEKILDRLVGYFCVSRSDGSLKDTDTLRILIEDGFDVFGGPERVLRS
jgi:hypothetical protein